ncbi:MAG: hypothetical protein IPM54_41115 [Polyangiaceae bacterium]|nr:hypothetical protein [Polyangiaceae bacterium]
MKQGAEIDSEAKANEIVETPSFYTNHCVVIMEQGPIELDVPAPRWRISATLLIHDVPTATRIEADLPFITIPPLVHTRQIVAIAKIPMPVARWKFRFESDNVRAKAKVWLFPGTSVASECGIFEVPHG